MNFNGRLIQKLRDELGGTVDILASLLVTSRMYCLLILLSEISACTKQHKRDSPGKNSYLRDNWFILF